MLVIILSLATLRDKQPDCNEIADGIVESDIFIPTTDYRAIISGCAMRTANAVDERS